MRGWRGYGACSVAAVLSLLSWLPDRAPVSHPLETGSIYSVQVDAQVGQFDLPPSQAGEQYLLVVANLSTGAAPAVVHARAQRRDAVELVPLQEVVPLRTKPRAARFAPQDAPRKVAEGRQLRCFYLPVSRVARFDPRGFRRIDGLLRGEGQHVRVYVDRRDRVDQRTVQWIVDQFDKSVWPNLTGRIGRPKDVDEDGKFSIVLTEWLDRLDDGRVALGGLVRSDDFRGERSWPHSNAADVMYLNAGLRPGAHLETLLAHELAHAVTISGRLRAAWWPWPATDEENWLNEAISHVAENMQSRNWSNLDYRVNRFLSAPNNAPLVVADYRQHGLWRDDGVRGSCYLFLRWCVEQYGSGIIPRLIQNGKKGVANIEDATGESFRELFRRYSVDLFMQSRQPSAEVSAVDGELGKLDLSRPLGRWGLAGPRFVDWDLNRDAADATSFSLCGTSMQYFVISADHRHARRIMLNAEGGADLQVSLVRLPDKMARLRLRVVAAADGSFRLRLSELSGTRVELEHMVWESSDHGERGGHRLVRQTNLVRWMGRSYVPAGGTIESDRLSGGELPTSACTLRIVGTDQYGNRVAAWADFDPRRVPTLLAADARARDPFLAVP